MVLTLGKLTPTEAEFDSVVVPSSTLVECRTKDDWARGIALLVFQRILTRASLNSTSIARPFYN